MLLVLDLCRIVNWFCFELPEDYVSFKSALHCIFLSTRTFYFFLCFFLVSFFEL
jgi:hypothetical protein